MPRKQSPKKSVSPSLRVISRWPEPDAASATRLLTLFASMSQSNRDTLLAIAERLTVRHPYGREHMRLTQRSQVPHDSGGAA